MEIPLFVAVGAEPFNPRFVIRAGRREDIGGRARVTLTVFPGDPITLDGADAEAWLDFVSRHSERLVAPAREQAPGEDYEPDEGEVARSVIPT